MFGRPFEQRRAGLVLLALFAGAAVPIQLITLSFGYAQYYMGIATGPKAIMTAHQFAAYYFPLIYIPALVLLLLIALYCRRHYPDIWRRIWVGFCMGAISTLALDAARQAGVLHGWLPADTAVMFGKMVTASKDFTVFYAVGLMVHYFNGASFGLFYAFMWGRRGSQGTAIAWAVTWLLVVELGMMTLPPMGPMVGLFGVNYAWPQLFLVTLVAHVLFGVALGFLVHHFLTDAERGGIFDYLRGGKTSRR